MSKKIDDKILEQLKDQVILKDRELEKKQVHESTKEALAEMTSLSRNEVDKLYSKLRDDAYKSQRKRNVIFGVIIGVLVIAGLVIANKIFNPPPPPQVFTENFDDTQNGWDNFNAFDVKKEILDGYLKFETFEKDGYIRDAYNAFDFPRNYDLVMKTDWQGGSTSESYGLHLTAANGDFGYFFIRQDGKARYGFKKEKKWVTDTGAKAVENFNLRSDVSNILKVAVRGNRFKYFVNDELIYESSMLGLKMTGLKVVCGSTQQVNFDYIRVTKPNSSQYIYQEEFEDNSKGWNTKTILKKKSEIIDSKYLFTAGVKDYCYWTDIPLPDYEQFELVATVGFKSGKKDDFGIMLAYDSNNFYAFEVQEEGEARILVHENKKFTYTGEYLETNQISSSDNPVQLRIKVTHNNIEYYVNKTLVDKRKRSSENFYLKEMGLRVCGEQTVYYDKIEITEILD